MKYTVIQNNGVCGICGYIWQTLRAMWHYPDSKYYVDFSKNCQYADSSVKTTDNVWEYYFEQPHIQTRPPVEEISTTIDKIIDVPESEFRDVFMKNASHEYISRRRLEYGNIIAKYLKLKPHIEEKVSNFVSTYFKGKKVLGVHFRGTDHPDKKEVFEYLQTIKNKAVDYDIIFCASDEAARYNALKTVFGKKVISYDSIRSTSSHPLHHSNDPTYYSSIPGYKLGEDVIIEAFLLSKTDFIFCCSNSNVNYLARAINPTLPYQAL